MLFGSLSCSGPKLLKKYLFLTHTSINPAQLPKKRKKKKITSGFRHRHHAKKKVIEANVFRRTAQE